jgi:hypothetical protein
MTASQALTLLIGLALATLAVCWAVLEIRRDRQLPRFALISGPYGGGTFWVVIPAVVLTVVVVYLVFRFELVPKGSPGIFTLTLGWISVALIAAIFAGVSIQVRRNALGWITLIGKDTLQIEADGVTNALTLRPGAVKLYPVHGNEQFVQFVITDGDHVAAVWGMVGIRGLKDLTEDYPMNPHGLMLAGSAERLRVWLKPYIATAAVAR